VTGNLGAFAPSGSGFLPLDQEPFAAVFDPLHKLVFASLPWLDVVDVISTTSHQLVKSIPVPGPEGLDMTLDDSQVLVGTTTDQFFAIDTTQLAVIGRTTIPPLKVGDVQPQWPVVTANGTILIIGSGDFPVGVFQWNPATRILIPRPDSNVGNVARAARSRDGSKVLFYDPGDGGASIYDSASDTFKVLQAGVLGEGAFPDGGAVNPTGTQVAVSVYGGPVIVTDGAGNLLQQLNTDASFGLLYSLDGTNLLSVALTKTSSQILSFDTGSFQLLGAAPAYASNTLGATRVLPWDPDLEPEIPLAVDDAGLIYGGADHGLAIDNSKNFQNFSSNAYVPVFVRWEPSEGPLNSTTNVTLNVGISWGFGSAFASPSVFVGSQSATNISAVQPEQLNFTVPASSMTGPRTLQIQQGDGTTTYLPLAFSYGSTLLPQVVQGLPPDGGVTADIFGYGLGVDVPSFATAVQLGGQQAPVTFKTIGINPPGAGGEAYPFPVQHLQVTAPAGHPGPSDILVTSSTGAATGAGAVHYLKSVRVVPATDQLTALAYDSTRLRLYLSAGGHVDVFDLSSGAFVSPISLPTLHGLGSSAGLTLTPDGSKLLVSDPADSSIAVINPDNPTSAVAVSIPFVPPPPGVQCMQNPGQIVATNSGKAYANIFMSGIDSCASFGVIELDISTLATRIITSATDPNNPLGFLGAGIPLRASRSGNTLAATDFNNIYVEDVAAGTWQSRQLDSNSNLYDIASSPDGSLITIRTTSYGIDIGFPLGEPYRDRYIGLDPGLNVTASLVSPELLQNFVGASSSGMQLHDSGSLIYAMRNQEVDLFDMHNGQERERVLLPERRMPETGTEGLSQTAIDETGLQIFLITQSGLTIVTLDSVPLSLSYATPSIGSSSGGIQVTIHGSGFDPSTTVTLGSSQAAVDFVDSNTLQIVTPATAKGALQAIVQNSDGETYTLDDVYTAN
jgi:hypothetical protein